ncbi:sulfite exporter TauE/SafE family protein [Gelatiniphilus marinus]|uniref:Probable membrane transporter protein n=1 Tax=Gelatiniphilus marinus TaxID=1759464 RepID=A0ABW5JT14_9FLAO
MQEFHLYLLIFGVGIAVGFINTIAGGGSLLTLPILIFCGLAPSVANGTNRIGIVFQTAMATAGFKSKGVSTFPFNVYLGISAIFGAIIGANIAVEVKGETFNKILALVMIIVVLLILFKPKLNTTDIQERLTGKYLWVGIIAFFFFGIYGGFINAGLGFIVILFLHFFHKMNLVRVNATKVVVVLIYTLSALVVFVINDKVDWKIGLILALGNGIGAWFGSRFSVKKGEGFIKSFLVVMIVIMSVKLWFFN